MATQAQVHQHLLTIVPAGGMEYRMGVLPSVPEREVPSYVRSFFSTLDFVYEPDLAAIASNENGTYFIAKRSNWVRYFYIMGWFKETHPEWNGNVYIRKGMDFHSLPQEKIVSEFPMKVEESELRGSVDNRVVRIDKPVDSSHMDGVRIDVDTIEEKLVISVAEDVLDKIIPWRKVVPIPPGWRVASDPSTISALLYPALLWERLDPSTGLPNAQILLTTRFWAKSDEGSATYGGEWINELVEGMRGGYIPLKDISRDFFYNYRDSVMVSVRLNDLRDHLRTNGITDDWTIQRYLSEFGREHLPHVFSRVDSVLLARLLALSWDIDDPEFIFYCYLDNTDPSQFSLIAQPLFISYMDSEGRVYRRSYALFHDVKFESGRKNKYVPRLCLMLPFFLDKISQEEKV